MSCQQVNIQQFLTSRCAHMLSLPTSNQNVCPKHYRTVHKGQFIMSFYNFFKTKTEQNKHLFFSFISLSLPRPPPVHRSIFQYQPERKALKAAVTAATQASHQRHNQQQQGKSRLAASPAAGDRGYKSEGETTHGRPKFDGIRAGKKNLDSSFLRRKPDILLTLVQTGNFLKKVFPS